MTTVHTDISEAASNNAKRKRGRPRLHPESYDFGSGHDKDASEYNQAWSVRGRQDGILGERTLYWLEAQDPNFDWSWLGFGTTPYTRNRVAKFTLLAELGRWLMACDCETELLIVQLAKGCCRSKPNVKERVRALRRERLQILREAKVNV